MNVHLPQSDRRPLVRLPRSWDDAIRAAVIAEAERRTVTPKETAA